jgi:hypothetical protein
MQEDLSIWTTSEQKTPSNSAATAVHHAQTFLNASHRHTDILTQLVLPLRHRYQSFSLALRYGEISMPSGHVAVFVDDFLKSLGMLLF